MYVYIYIYIYGKDAAAAYDRSVEKAKWRIWKKARLIACTAASAVHVTRRLMQVSFAYNLFSFVKKSPARCVHSSISGARDAAVDAWILLLICMYPPPHLHVSSSSYAQRHQR